MPTMIPPELTDYVLDFLHDDPKSLKACALAARALRPAARFHLFRTVHVFSLRSGQKFWHLLQRDPALGQHARHAVFAKLTPLASSSVSVPPSSSVPPIPDAPLAPLLWPALFHALPAVTRLEFLYVLMTDPPLRHALAAHFPLVTSLTLQFCRLPSFADFAALVDSFPALAELSLLYVGWADADAGDGAGAEAEAVNVIPRRSETEKGEMAGAGRRRLMRLTLGRDLDLETVVDWLVAEGLCAGLRSLSVCPASPADVLVLWDVLRAAAPSLEELALDWYGANYNDVALPHGFALPPLPALHTLTLSCPLNMHGTASWLPALLAQLRSPALEKLFLEVRLLGELDGVDWGAVDELFARAAGEDAGAEEKAEERAFSQLRDVRVRVKTWHTASVRGADACAAVRARLPQLAARGVLRVEA
ncbi:hypothetical protein EIP86_011275 [Pleurotus ostreatoroseus]|nr:hypothetical protein EIP86_011275 [Pleurotus ostreatoroseus]